MRHSIKIKLRLRRGSKARSHRLRFRAKIFKLQLRTPQLSEHRLDKLPVSFSQALLKQASGNPDDQTIFLRAFQTRGPKPCGEAVRIYATLGVQENLIPEVHRANLPFATISTEVEILWKSPVATGGMLSCVG